jgi:hypothetical protein
MDNDIRMSLKNGGGQRLRVKYVDDRRFDTRGTQRLLLGC